MEEVDDVIGEAFTSFAEAFFILLIRSKNFCLMGDQPSERTCFPYRRPKKLFAERSLQLPLTV